MENQACTKLWLPFLSRLPPAAAGGIGRFPVPETSLFLSEVPLILQDLQHESTALKMVHA